MMNFSGCLRLVWLGLIIVFASPSVDGAETQKTGSKGDNKVVSQKGASLGVVLRKPTSEEITSFSLAGSKRHPEGHLITKVFGKSAAEKAGIRVGDMLISLNKNRIYSTDDLEDFMKVSQPGIKIDVLIKRAKTQKEVTLTTTLGSSEQDSQTSGLTWQFAGMGQLDRALSVATQSGKPVLVGLSGANT